MRRVISMPVAIIAAAVMLAGFASIVRPFIVDPYFLSGIVSGVSLESTTKTANRLAGSLSLAFSLIL